MTTHVFSGPGLNTGTPVGEDLRKAVGQVYHCGLSDGTRYYGYLFEPDGTKSGGFHWRTDTATKDALIAYSSPQLIDRDLAFFPRVTDGDFSGGGYQEVWIDPTKYFDSDLDPRTAGYLQLRAQWARVQKLAIGAGTYSPQVVPWAGDFWFTFGETSGNIYSANGGATTTPGAVALVALDSDGSYLYAGTGTKLWRSSDGIAWTAVTSSINGTATMWWVVNQGTNGYFAYYQSGPNLLYKIDLTTAFPIAAAAQPQVPVGSNAINIVDLVEYQTSIAILTTDVRGPGCDAWYFDGTNLTRIVRIEGYKGKGVCQALGSLYVSAVGVQGGSFGGVIPAPDVGTETITYAPGVVSGVGVLASLKPAASAIIAPVGVPGPFATSNLSPITPAFGQATTAGNLLLAWVSAETNDPATVAAGWSKIVSAVNGASWVAIWAKPNCGASETPPAFTTAVGGMFAQLAEFSGAALAAPTDQISTATTAGTSVTMTNPAADAAYGDLLVMATRWKLSTNGAPSVVDAFNNGTAVVQAGSGNAAFAGAPRYSNFTYGLIPQTPPIGGSTSPILAKIDSGTFEIVARPGSPFFTANQGCLQPRSSSQYVYWPLLNPSIHGISAKTGGAAAFFGVVLQYDVLTGAVTHLPAFDGTDFDTLAPQPLRQIALMGDNVGACYRYGGGVNGALQYQLPTFGTIKYQSSGWLASSHLDFGTPGIQKRFRRVEVHHAPLNAGEQIFIEAFVDTDPLVFTTALAPVPAGASATNTTVGSSLTALAFGADTVGKTMYFAVKLTAGTGQTTTPRVSYVSVEIGGTWVADLYLACTSRRQMLSQEADSQGATAADLAYLLLLAQENGSLLTFYHPNGQLYTMAIESLDAWNPTPLKTQENRPQDEEYVIHAILRQVA